MSFLLTHALETEELPLWKEIWQYITDKYFSVSLDGYHYSYISTASSTLLSARAMIAAIFVGIIIAAAIAMFQKRTLGDFVRALHREHCNSPEEAKTLEELGFLRNAAVKEGLRRGSSLGRVVRCVEKQAFEAEMEQKRLEFEAAKRDKAAAPRGKWKEIPYKIDFSTDRFYIPDELAYGAITHFSKKGTNPLVFAFTVIVCIAMISLCCSVLPEILQMVDNFIGVFKG